jgi:hypothetical protein
MPGFDPRRLISVGRLHDHVQPDVARRHRNASLNRLDRRGSLLPGPYNFRSPMLNIGAANAFGCSRHRSRRSGNAHLSVTASSGLEVLTNTADPHCLAVTLRRSSDGLEGAAHPLVSVLP